MRCRQVDGLNYYANHRHTSPGEERSGVHFVLPPRVATVLVRPIRTTGTRPRAGSSSRTAYSRCQLAAASTLQCDCKTTTVYPTSFVGRKSPLLNECAFSGVLYPKKTVSKPHPRGPRPGRRIEPPLGLVILGLRVAVQRTDRGHGPRTNYCKKFEKSRGFSQLRCAPHGAIENRLDVARPFPAESSRRLPRPVRLVAWADAFARACPSKTRAVVLSMSPAYVEAPTPVIIEALEYVLIQNFTRSKGMWYDGGCRAHSSALLGGANLFDRPASLDVGCVFGDATSTLPAHVEQRLPKDQVRRTFS